MTISIRPRLVISMRLRVRPLRVRSHSNGFSRTQFFLFGKENEKMIVEGVYRQWNDHGVRELFL